MGLFEKKFCGVCGGKIGLLGNHKLADANLCGDCNKKLSVWFEGRKESTLERIKAHLSSREANAAMLQDFRPTRSIGTDGDKFFLIDENMGRFIILREGEDMNKNPDLLEISGVRDARLEIKEDRSEVRRKDANGNMVSFDPRHYSYRYKFLMTIDYNGEYFNTIKFQLNTTSINGGADGDGYTGVSRGPSLMQSAAGQLLGQLGIDDPANVQRHIMRTGDRRGRTDLPGGYRADGLTTMTDADIRRYREYEDIGAQIISCLLSNKSAKAAEKPAPAPGSAEETADAIRGAALSPEKFGVVMGMGSPAQAAPAESWKCPFCGGGNTGKFCKDCGAPRQ